MSFKKPREQTPEQYSRARKLEAIKADRHNRLVLGIDSGRYAGPEADAVSSSRLKHAVEALYVGHDEEAKLEVSQPRDLLKDKVILSLLPHIVVDRLNVRRSLVFGADYSGRLEVVDKLEIRHPENLGEMTLDISAWGGWLTMRELRGTEMAAPERLADQAADFLEGADLHVKEVPNEIASLDQIRPQSPGQRSLQPNPQ